MSHGKISHSTALGCNIRFSQGQQREFTNARYFTRDKYPPWCIPHLRGYQFDNLLWILNLHFRSTYDLCKSCHVLPTLPFLSAYRITPLFAHCRKPSTRLGTWWRLFLCVSNSVEILVVSKRCARMTRLSCIRLAVAKSRLFPPTTFSFTFDHYLEWFMKIQDQYINQDICI